jgi:hypothetical protein
MKIEVSRFKDGELKVTYRHENNSYFWKSDLTECPKFENEKLKLEVLMMVDWWNKKHHTEFELLWNSLLERT